MKQTVGLLKLCLLVALGLTGGGLQAFAQHIHLNAGTPSQTQDARLYFVNGPTYDIFSNLAGSTPPSPSCFFLPDDDPDLYPNLYQTDATFTVLPATVWTGGPAPNAPAQGSYIEMRLVSVAGPPGGEIGFWSESIDGTQTTNLFKIPVGTTNGTNQYNLSDGTPGQGVSTRSGLDPFGHIHGRRFTTNKPGLYTLGVQLFDTSHNGTNGGPIHLPSLTNYFYFQSGLFFDAIAKTNSTVTVRFGVQAFYTYDLQVSTNLAGTNWVTLDTIIGANHSDIHYISDPNATDPARFYRLRGALQE